MGALLYIIASFIKWALTPLLYGFGFVISIYKHEGSKWHEQLAISKDRYGNVLGQYLMNWLLITKAGYKFGNGKETISSVLGKNERDNTLTLFGSFWADTLNSIQKDHCKNSIDN